MNDDRRSLTERTGLGSRRLVGFLERNWTHLIEDAVVIVGWVVLLTVVFARFEGPRWAYGLSVVVGIVVYTLLRDPFDLSEPERDEEI